MNGNIGIVGAGLLGRTLAIELLKRNYRVTLFDRDSIGGVNSCAYTGAGMLSPYCELDGSDSLIFALGRNSVSAWSSIVPSLPLPVFMQNAGTLVVAHGADEVLLQQFYLKLERKIAHCADQVVWLNSDQLAQLEPSTERRFSGAHFAKDEGQIDNRQLLIGLAAGLVERPSSCTWLSNTEVTSIVDSEVQTKERVHRFDLVVDCRGMGAKNSLEQLRGVRGEMVVVHSPDVVLNRPVRVLHPRYAIYVVPRPDQMFLIGATTIECEDYSQITVLSALELLSAVFCLNPAFARASIVETRVNCRPAMPNNLPLIRLSPGLIEVNGLYRHGFLVTPSLVALLINQIEGRSCDPQFEQLFVKRTATEIIGLDQRRRVNAIGNQRANVRSS